MFEVKIVLCFVVALCVVGHACAYMATIELPDNARYEIEQCQQRAKAKLGEDMQWQGQLACLHAYYGGLEPNNLTDEDRSLFENATADRFGFAPPPSGHRIRREIRTLTDDEWNAVADVFVKMYERGIIGKFGRLHGQAIGRAHKGAAFLGWHRVFLTHFEEEMRKINPSVALPYWDYTIDNNITIPTNSVVWTSCFFGDDNDTVTSGKFKKFYGAHGALISRKANFCPAKLINKIDITNIKEQCDFKAITTGAEKNYFGNPHNLELLHDGVHDWIGGDMGLVPNSAFDPVFWMHHAFIDYIFEQFRTRQQKECNNIDVETNYRPIDDLCQKCKNRSTEGHGKDDKMFGYDHLRNIDGLWLNWTTAFYSYEQAPSCPDNCKGPYLYCDATADLDYPQGLCLTVTKEACKEHSLRRKRNSEISSPLEPKMSCNSGNRHKGLYGDGRTRDMSFEQAQKILKEQTDPSIQNPVPDKRDNDGGARAGIATGCILIGLVVGFVFGCFVLSKMPNNQCIFNVNKLGSKKAI